MSWFQQIFLGHDPAEEQARGDALDAALRAENERDRAGHGERWFEEANENIERGHIEDVAGDIGAAWDEGWAEGEENIRAAVGGTVDTVIGTPLRLIPWQLWVIGAIVAFFYFGGLAKFLPKR